MSVLFVPTINDDPQDFDKIFEIWDQYRNEKAIEIDMSACTFIRQSGVAFLGGLITHVRLRGGSVQIKLNSLRPEIRNNLAQNGFLKAMGEDEGPWDGNSIPYRHDNIPNPEEIILYLQNKWIGRGWLHVSQRLSDAIVGIIWEIYANAFEHSNSLIGVFSCGQHYPRLNELTLTIIDFGIGIPGSVRAFLEKDGTGNNISDETALEMAFKSGFTTKPEKSRGIGLDLLKEFIQKNRGQLDVYSNSAHVKINDEEEIYGKIPAYFNGTAINIKLICDESYYYLGEEDIEEPFF